MEVLFEDRMPTNFLTGETKFTDAVATLATKKKEWVKLNKNKDTVSCTLCIELGPSW